MHLLSHTWCTQISLHASATAAGLLHGRGVLQERAVRRLCDPHNGSLAAASREGKYLTGSQAGVLLPCLYPNAG